MVVTGGRELPSSPTVADLPAVLRVPLSQPPFVLRSLFILVVCFASGGITIIAAGRECGGGRGGPHDNRRPTAIRAHHLVDSRHSSPTTATFGRAQEVDPRHNGGTGGRHGGTLSACTWLTYRPIPVTRPSRGWP